MAINALVAVFHDHMINARILWRDVPAEPAAILAAHSIVIAYSPQMFTYMLLHIDLLPDVDVIVHSRIRAPPLCVKHSPLSPHPGGDLALFFAEGVGVDRGSFHVGMPHPLLQHVKLDAGADRIDAVAMP